MSLLQSMASSILISWVHEIGAATHVQCVVAWHLAFTARPLSSTRTKGVIFRGTTLLGSAPHGAVPAHSWAITGLPG